MASELKRTHYPILLALILALLLPSAAVAAPGDLHLPYTPNDHQVKKSFDLDERAAAMIALGYPADYPIECQIDEDLDKNVRIFFLFCVQSWGMILIDGVLVEDFTFWWYYYYDPITDKVKAILYNEDGTPAQP